MNNNTPRFDPRDFGFRCFELRNDTLHFFEYDIGFNTPNPDFTLLNTYLTQDGDFVTIWWGLFDPFITEGEIEWKAPEGFHFQDQYNTDLFRGFIENKADAEIILKSLRFERFKPQRLSVNKEGCLDCSIINP